MCCCCRAAALRHFCEIKCSMAARKIVSHMNDLCNIPLVLLRGHILSEILLSMMNYMVFFLICRGETKISF